MKTERIVPGKMNEVPNDQQEGTALKLRRLLEKACGPENKFVLLVWTDESDQPMITGDVKVRCNELLSHIEAMRDSVLGVLKKKAEAN